MAGDRIEGLTGLPGRTPIGYAFGTALSADVPSHLMSPVSG